VRELSARSWRKEVKKSASEKRIPGLGLVRLEPDPNDERVQRVYLSKKGKQLAHKLLACI
jgi:DNA-binding MarR family transcriptional regulator